MMGYQNKAGQYRTMSSYGLVADASPERLIQISLEGILAHLATAQGCMARIRDHLPLVDVVAKGQAIGKAVRLIGHLNDSLDMERGGEVAVNLRNLYLYMLDRLTEANISNDPALVGEVADLLRRIKDGWDQLVAKQS